MHICLTLCPILYLSRHPVLAVISLLVTIEALGAEICVSFTFQKVLGGSELDKNVLAMCASTRM